jgi:dinuclear metal center YbgI/SA1388 family protein
LSAPLSEIVEYLDGLLDIGGVEDASLNGLQLEASDVVRRVGLAVDAAAATVAVAADQECDLLCVHHGLFWGAQQPLRASLGATVARCFSAGISVYGAHLPLDIHAEVGNNALVAAAVGAVPGGTFGPYGGRDLGVVASYDQPIPLADLAGRLAAAGCDEQTMWAFGTDPVSTIAVITGSGCSFLDAAAATGADCFITGEPRHSAYHQARELGINCIFAGHYATETFGVRALGERLATEFDVETRWIHLPTGI